MYFFLMSYIIVIAFIMNKVSTNGKTFKIMFSGFQVSFKGGIFWMILLSAPFVYVATVRDLSVGTDTASIYRNIYYSGYAVNNWRSSIYEGLFIQYVKMLYRIYPDFLFLLAVSASIITVIFMSYFIAHRREINVSIAMLIFFAWLFCPGLNALRQILAVSIAFIGLTLLEKRKPVWAAILFVVVCFVHVTTIVMFVYFIPYFFGQNKKWREKIPMLFFLGPVAMILFLTTLVKIPIFTKFSDYVGQFSFATINVKYYIFPLLMLPLVLVSWNALVKIKESNYIHLCGYIFIFTAVFMSGFLWYAFRIMFFFMPSMAILLGQLDKCYTGKFQRRLVNVYIVVALVMAFVFVYIFRDTDGIYPYVFASQI